ncbi:MAG: VOC family protein [Acidobacteria bacterium]|nr:VOC family protein [Acidobacteriota bacterium]
MSAISSLVISSVELSVASLDRSLQFYQHVLGLTVLDASADQGTLGVPDRPLLHLVQQSGARPSLPSSPGLFHFALLVPHRAALAQFVRHLLDIRHPVHGVADHLVSEALYLGDPDGHGIEVYVDRPREQWSWDGPVLRMATDPLDLESLLAEPDAPWVGMPEGTTMGHVHLRVTDLAAAQQFYCDLLGLDLMTTYPGALFVSAAGYHHHFGLNVWQSRQGSPAPAECAQLRAVELIVPAAELGRLQHSTGISAHPLLLSDPAGNQLIFSTRPD